MIPEIFLRDSLLWSCSWQSTIFLVAGLVGSFILKHRSSRAHQLLFLSMIAAVTVPFVSILVRHYELGLFAAEPIIIQSPAKDLTTTSDYTNSTVISTEDIEYKPGPIEENLPLVVSGSKSIKLPWRSILLYGWIAASLLLAARLLITFVLGVRILGRSLPLHCERIEQALHLAGAKLGIDKDVKVYSSNGIRSPVIWCWKRNPILLVPNPAGRLNNKIDWAGVLCHELAHWKRRDHICGLLSELVVCILPWHPLLWWAKSRLVKLSEQACDDWVLATGQPCTDYAESLLDLTPQVQMAFVPAVVRSKRGLADRVQRILQDKCGNPRTGLIWALTAGIVAICITVGVAFAQTRPAKTEGTKDKTYYEVSFQLGRDIDVELDAAPEGMRKIVHAQSIRFDKTGSDIKATLRANVRKGLHFEWRTRIELLGDGGIILDQQDTLNNSRSLVSGQPVVEKLVIEFSPFKQDEVANARRFRIHFEQAGPLLDELGRPYDADRTDWIRGRVTGMDGQPAVNAIVLINEHKPEGGPFRVPRVGIDEKGYYRFGAVDWPYRIGAEHKQPVPSTNVDCYQILSIKRIFNGPQEIDFQFHEPPKGTTSLIGRVVDTKKAPIREFTTNVSIADDLRELYSEDANVADEDFVKSFWFNQEVNNEDGVFRLDNIPAGKYRIQIIPKQKQYEWHRQEVVLADNKTNNLVLEIPSKLVLYGRVLFEDGSPAVIKPEPWPGARTRIIVPIGGRARGLAAVEEDGYFTAYFNESELERLKSTGRSLVINVPTAQRGRSKTVGRFPIELLSTEKNKAGTVKVRRPEPKSLPVSDKATPEVDSRGAKQDKDNPSSEPDDKKAEESRNVEVRVVHFPTDRSLGKLSVQDTTQLRRITYWFHWGDPTEWEYLCEAKGDVHVPADKRLSLTIRPTALRDLSPLAKLRPDDLYGIAFEDTPRYQTRATDECMTYIVRLTGLKSLTLRRTNITDRGLRYIGNLKSLEHLVLPARVTDRGMAYVAELNSLKRLYFSIIDGSSQVTNAGLRYLAKLTNLEELVLTGERMGDAGLVYIKDLPRLEYLFIRGSHFGDNGMVHVKNISSLRILSFHEGIADITDAGLAHISDLPRLESLCLHGLRDITDEGLTHLSKMRSLRKLEIGSSQVTDKGLGYLAQIKTLEHLELPQEQKGITDKGLTCLGRLPNLKYLSISRIHYNDPKMNKEYYTDKGLAELTKCRLLEELHIGSIGITDAGMEHIAVLTNLEKLTLFGCDNVTDDGLVKLTTLKSLRNLSITEADISIEGLNNLKPMPNLTNLKVYDLQRNSAILDLSALTALEDLSLNFRPRTQDEFVDADLMGLANLKKLKWLQIGPRNYTDKGMAYLAGLTNMERLGIGGAGLTDEGLKYLTNMKKLNHLSILGKFDPNIRNFTKGGKITDKGLRYLEEIKSLSFLNIYSENTFSTAALQSLQRELPNLFYLMVNGRNALGRINLTGMEQQSPAPSQAALSAQIRPQKPVAASNNETKPSMSLYPSADYSNIASGTNTKVLHFPPDQSVGVVYTQDEDLFIPETVKGFHPGYSYAERENFCPARGEVRIPPGKRVILTIRGVGAIPKRFRKALESLGPDDLYGLEFFFLSPIHIDDDLMATITRMKGLKILNLNCVRVTPKGLALVSQLPQLEHFFTPNGMTDVGMAEVAKIQSLKDLNVFFDRMTNEGLRSMGKLKSLEVLFLYGNPKMTDDGLRALIQLRSLKHLRLGKEGLFTDRGMTHLAAMPSLKVLWLDTHNVTDEGLRRLAQSRSLERLCICWLDKITDRGISYLTAMPQFKGLNAMQLKLLTDATMAHLGTMPNIDDLRLPYGFTDAGINHLANLDHLKYLWVNCADNSQLTDKSLATISNLRRLEELHISGTGFTNEGIKLLRNLQNLSTLHISFRSGLDNETLKLFVGLPKLRELSWGSSDNVTMSGLNVLNRLSGLESLSVHDLRQDDGGLDLSGLKKLSRLRIMTRHHATRAGKEFMTTWDEYHDSDLMSLSGLTSLENLSLAGPGIGDAGLKHLASLTNLKYLDIGGSANLTDYGLKYLANMRRLDSLTIGDSRIAERGLAHLYPLKTLHIIRITSAVPVSGKAIARLRTELPHLQSLDISQPQPPPRRPRTSRPRGRP